MTEATEKQPLALVVDDDPELRTLARRVAQAAGFRTEDAENGLIALEKMQACPPAVVLLDLQMPHADGLDVMRGIALHKISTKLVILCGQNLRIAEVAAEVARRHGLAVVAAVHKPVDSGALKTILARLSAESAPFDADRLQESIAGNAIELCYQPKIDLPSRRVTGVEALLRCRDGGGKPICPEAIIGIAEQSEQIHALSMRIFDKAITQYHDWAAQGLELGIAVNLSAKESADCNLPDRIAEMCERQGMPTSALTIELTESAVMNDQLVAMETMLRLRMRGFDLSIDDFGTGYSSLLRLEQLPFSEIKIDKSFVTTRRHSSGSRIILATVAQMARSFGMKCVIEGVEDEDTLNFANSLGCDSAQGYFMSQGLAPERMAGFITEWNTRQDWLRHRTTGREPATQLAAVTAKAAS
jgi:EAL domain-containing protein (putative c-di-GMP-specific phosphodiesterase class I)/ActR/RegA family two-component response regulator